MSTISIIGSGSMAAAIGGLAVKAGHTVEVMSRDAANVLTAGPAEGHPLDVFIAGDDAEAKARVSAFVESLGLRPMDTGALPMARTLEHVCLLSLGLLTHSIKNTNFAIGVSLLG